MIYIIDTYAWIEYIKGSSQGLILKKLFENQKDKFITLECSLAEIKGVCSREKINFNEFYHIVKTNSIILRIQREHWLNAADIKTEFRKKRKNFGLIDAVLIAKQKELSCSLITGDPHFKGLKDVVFVG